MKDIEVISIIAFWRYTKSGIGIGKEMGIFFPV